jgi:hypothetical protein
MYVRSSSLHSQHMVYLGRHTEHVLLLGAQNCTSWAHTLSLMLASVGSASQQNYECGVVFLQFSQICSPEPHIHKFATWPLTLIRHSQICSVNGAFTNLLVLSGREKKCTAYPRPRSTPAYGAVRLSVDLWASDTRFDCWGCWPAGACGCSCSSSSSMTATSALIASSSRLNSWRPTAGDQQQGLRCSGAAKALAGVLRS